MSKTSGAYYNEIDPFAAAWLRELIKDNLIAPGEVDERSIEDVVPTDLRGFTQGHFFAGIGVWSYALRRAGWGDDQPIWTGSCPCQPFSAAGKGTGVADERHLWPAWFHLIEQCRPAVIFGEQVTAAIKHGWLDLVQADLEGIGYAVGAQGMAACSVGAPHIRKRLYVVADSQHAERRTEHKEDRDSHGRDGLGWGGSTGILAVPNNAGLEMGLPSAEFQPQNVPVGQSSLTSFWSNVEWLPCADGKARPAQPGIFPLASGVTNRVGTLRGAGNAITSPVAEAFIRAYIETREA